jgi:hypothetical protein
LLYQSLPSPNGPFTRTLPIYLLAQTIATPFANVPIYLSIRLWPNRFQAMQYETDYYLNVRAFATQRDSLVIFDHTKAVRTVSATQKGYQCLNDVWCFNPVPCILGTFKADDGELSPCLPCPAGTYASEPGATSCNPCSQDQYCPMGTAFPRPQSTSVISTQTQYPFPIRSTTSTVQQRMISAVFSPLPQSQAQVSRSSKQQFFTLLGTAILGLVLVATIALLNYKGFGLRYAYHSIHHDIRYLSGLVWRFLHVYGCVD